MLKMKKKTKNIPGLIMIIVGFLMILTNALDYLTGQSRIHPTIFILGIVFVAVGQMMNRKKK